MIWDIIEQKLVNGGYGQVAVNIFREHMPGDVKIGFMLKSPLSGIPVDPYLPGFHKTPLQVIVRHTDPAVGEVVANNVMKLLSTEAAKSYPATSERGALILHRLMPDRLPIRFPRLEGNGFEWSLNFRAVYAIHQ